MCSCLCWRWIVGAVVCRWIVGAVAWLVVVSGCRIQAGAVRWMRRRGGGNSVGVCSVTVQVGQTALDSELQQLIIAQVTVERIILEGNAGSC